MDAPPPPVYDTAGRTGTTPRGGGRCVSASISARSRDRISGGLEQGKDPLMASINSLGARSELAVGGKTYVYYSLRAAEAAGLTGVSRLPASMKVLLENLLRNEDGVSVGAESLKKNAAWIDNKGSVEHEISFRPARVLMQDFTGGPAGEGPGAVGRPVAAR